MRKINFRCKSHVTGEWVYFSVALLLGASAEYIHNTIGGDKLDATTLGMDTGLKDMHGAIIYEGDILECKTYCGGRKFSGEHDTYRFVVIFQTDGFKAQRQDYKSFYAFSLLDEPRCIGNIYENPELLTK